MRPGRLPVRRDSWTFLSLFPTVPKQTPELQRQPVSRRSRGTARALDYQGRIRRGRSSRGAVQRLRTIG